MNERPFYSPRTPTPSSRAHNNVNSFPFPEEVDTNKLLSEEEEVGFEDDITLADTESNLDDLTYGNGSVTPQENYNTNLDETLEKIGMKRYQWTLL